MEYKSELMPPERKPRKSLGKGFAALALCALLLCGTAAGSIWAIHSFKIIKTNPSLSAIIGYGATPDMMKNEPGYVQPLVTKGDGTAMTASELYEKYVSSTVGIVTEGTTTNIFGQQTNYAASGTGFVVSQDGYIVTNCHVIDGGSKFTVSFENGRTFDAKLVGSDAENDVALLKIEAAGLQPVVIGDSDDIRVGEAICAIGNPLGELTFSLTKGVVSALNRVVTTGDDESNFMFQIDAAVNSGNSGGPVFNDCGQVIGVVTAKYSSSGVEGLGFALPINDVARIVNELKTNGVVRKVSFGITVGNATYSDSGEDTSIAGARVKVVDSGSCSEEAGLRVDDIITGLDSMKISGVTDLLAAKKRYVPDETAELTVVRDGKEIQLTLVFDEAAEETPQPPQTNTPDGWMGQDPFGGLNPFGGWR